MVAATLASGKSCHLWYHMFASDELLDTHITGFMASLLLGTDYYIIGQCFMSIIIMMAS